MAVELIALKIWALAAALKMVPPGNTQFSVAPVAECAGALICPGAKYSSFYDTWVRKETAEQGNERYKLATEELSEECYTKYANNAEGPFTPETCMASGLAVAIAESGLREDVQVGRGWAKKASDDGGMGLGPGKEVCFGQLHPVNSHRILLPGEKLSDLLGLDRISVRRCWRATVAALARSKSHCAWRIKTDNKKIDSIFAMYSQYGTGNTCYSANRGKTLTRVRYYRSIMSLKNSL